MAMGDVHTLEERFAGYAAAFLKTQGAAKCKHERLNEEGWCRACGADCRGIG